MAAAAPFGGARPQPYLGPEDGVSYDGEHERPDTIGAYYGEDHEGAEVRLRDRHQSFRTGATARLQRGSSGAPPPQRSPTGLAGLAAGGDEAAARKFRRRWDDSAGGGSAREREEDVRGGSVDGGALARQGGNTGHIVRMRRGEAWGKFLAYEGSCQVCMVEGAKGVPEASYFLSSGCAPLRTGLGISGLLLPAVLPAHLAANDGGSIDLGNEIVWDDCDSGKGLNAAAFVNRMSVIRLRVAKLALSGRGNWWSRLTAKRGLAYSSLTVHMRMAPVDPLAPVDVRFRLGASGATLAGSPTYELQPDYGSRDIVLEVSDGYGVVARGAVSCKRLWQIGMEHAPMGDPEDGGYADEDAPAPGGEAGGGTPGAAPPGAAAGICAWFKDDARVPLRAGATGIWVSVFGEGGAAGQVLLSIARVQREMPANEGSASAGEAAVRGGTLKVSSCQAYDYLLMAALRAQMCDERRLEVSGEWSWLLTAFAGHYGVRSNYAVMSHLRWVLKPGVASVSRGCFELLARQLRPLLAQEGMGGSLTQQESTMLTRIKRDAEELLKLCFENYHLLSSTARKGILEATAGLTNQPAAGGPEFPPEALVAGMSLLDVMRDVFLPSDAEWLTDRFRLAAKARWARLALACDDGAGAEPSANPLLSAPLRQALGGKAGPGGSPAGRAAPLYARMGQVAAAIVQDVEYDRRLQDVPRLLPSALHLPAITAAEYCTNYVAQLRAVLGQAPPHQPTDAAIDMLVSVAGLQRYLEEHGLAPPRGSPGAIDALELFGHHVRSWLTNSQEGLCATARSLEATTELSAVTGLGATQPAAPAGGSEEGGVAPIVHEMLRAVVNEMHRYERVICHWPVFGPHLEAALCCVLRSIMSAVSRQCGMTRVRGGNDPALVIGGGGGAFHGGGGGGSPTMGRGGGGAGARQGPPGGAFGVPPPESGGRASRLAVGGANQWAWAADSPRRGGGNAGAPRCLLMVREAVLLNSVKRLMVAVPSYEASINRWSGGPSAPPPGPPASPTRAGPGAPPQGAPPPGAQGAGKGGFDPYSYSDDVAPHVGAQFAQVVKELRTEYAAAVGACAERMSLGLASAQPTSVRAILAAARHAVAAAGANPSALQQQALIEGLAEPLFRALEECLSNLQAALDPRVFVAVGRGLWDFVGRQLYEFIEQLQEGSGDHRGAWRSRQNASLLLGLINSFFKGGLMAHMDHGLQDRDLAAPLHIDACLRLLASSTTALNSSFTPF